MGLIQTGQKSDAEVFTPFAVMDWQRTCWKLKSLEGGDESPAPSHQPLP
jgi:hypothetical protein